MTASDTSSAGPPPPGPDPATGLYPGQSAPLAAVTATDQGGVVVIGTALALVFALVSILIRLYVRFQFQRSVVSRDDVASAASLVFFIIQAGLVFGQVHQGLGKTMEDVSPFGLVALQKVRQLQRFAPPDVKLTSPRANTLATSSISLPYISQSAPLRFSSSVCRPIGTIFGQRGFVSQQPRCSSSLLSLPRVCVATSLNRGSWSALNALAW